MRVLWCRRCASMWRECGGGQPCNPRGQGFWGCPLPTAPSLSRISLVEPGPVMTEFETKLYEEAERTDYSRTDPETAEIFTKLYLRSSKDVFTSLGQTPEDIAEVTGGQGAPVGWGCPAGLGWAEVSISPNKERRCPASSGAVHTQTAPS